MLGSATSLMNDVPAENSEDTITPASRMLTTRLPRVRAPMTYTSATVSRLKANAMPVMPPRGKPSRIASAAPKHAPEDAPRISGAAMGF